MASVNPKLPECRQKQWPRLGRGQFPPAFGTEHPRRQRTCQQPDGGERGVGEAVDAKGRASRLEGQRVSSRRFFTGRFLEKPHPYTHRETISNELAAGLPRTLLRPITQVGRRND